MERSLQFLHVLARQPARRRRHRARRVGVLIFGTLRSFVADSPAQQRQAQRACALGRLGLLSGEGYTIRGVQRLLREQGVRFVQNVWQPGAPQPTRQPAEEDDAVAETEAAEDAAALRLPLLRGAGGHERPQSSEDQHADAARAMAPSAGGLARKDVQKLQAALHDLTECRRLLDAALAEKI